MPILSVFSGFNDGCSMSLKPRPRTKKTPRNKSDRAIEAEFRGERVWTGWRLRDLAEQILRVNLHGVTEKQIRAVRNLEYLKVKLLRPSQQHHTGLRMPGSVQSKKDRYFRLDQARANKLKPSDLESWRAHQPTEEELDEAVENLAGRRYYRERKCYEAS